MTNQAGVVHELAVHKGTSEPRARPEHAWSMSEVVTKARMTTDSMSANCSVIGIHLVRLIIVSWVGWIRGDALGCPTHLLQWETNTSSREGRMPPQLQRCCVATSDRNAAVAPHGPKHTGPSNSACVLT